MNKSELVACIYKHAGRTDDMENLAELAEEIAKMAADEEREACAQVCDFEVCGSQGFAGPTCCILPPEHDGAHKYGVPMAKTQRECAAAIRARSNV